MNREFNVIDENGNIIPCQALATYHHDETNKDFIVYTDGTSTENDYLRLYYSLYEEINGEIRLITITDLEDNEIGEQIVRALVKKVNSLS